MGKSSINGLFSMAMLNNQRVMDINGYYPLVSENVELVDHDKIGCIDRMKTYIADSATLNMMETLPKMPF